MRTAVVGISVCLALCALPAHALDLRTAGGLLFDVADTSDGTLVNGSIDAYDGAFALTVDGTLYATGGQAGSLVMDGRAVKTAEVVVGDLQVRRIVYVPKSGGNYARYLDIIVNRGATERTVEIRYTGNLGSDSGTVVVNSSSGDALPDPADAWFSTDDIDGSGDPSLAHVLQGTTPRVRAGTVRLDLDNFAWDFTAPVPAGGRVAVLTFAVQGWNQVDVQAEAHWLSSRPAEAMVGIEAYTDDIINY